MGMGNLYIITGGNRNVCIQFYGNGIEMHGNTAMGMGEMESKKSFLYVSSFELIKYHLEKHQ